MGGYRSGRTGGQATVEGCASLILCADDITRPIREMMRELGFRAIPDGRQVAIPWRRMGWSRRGEAEPWAVVEYRLELRAADGTAWLRYDVDHYGRRTGPQEYPVRMVTTACRYGGQRWWWLCPATGLRVSKLYLPNGGTRFLSRGQGGYRLAYASQRHGQVDRMHARSRQLYARLRADYCSPSGYGWPPKPKGMRWRTYNEICEKLEAEAYGLNMDLLRVTGRLMRISKG